MRSSLLHARDVLAVATLASLAACSYDFDQFAAPSGGGASITTTGGGAGRATGSSSATTTGQGGASAGAGGGAMAGTGGSTAGGSGGAATADSGGESDGGPDGAPESGPMVEDGAAEGMGIGDVIAQDMTSDATRAIDAAREDGPIGAPDASQDAVVIVDRAAPDAGDVSAEAAGDASPDGAAEAGCVGDACAPCTDSTECSCDSHNGHVYRFCTTARSWTDSETQCTSAGMRLARVDDALENAWIRSTADAHAMGETWIGIEDPAKTLHWQWPDGTQFWMGTASGSAVGGLYNDWAANNPGGNPIRNCASILGASAQWSDRSCSSLLPYVCELY